MKRCPQCNRVESDEGLKFCRVDGATLVSDSFPLTAEGETAQLSSASAANEIETSILPHSTDSNINRATAPTNVLPAQPAPLPTKRPPRSGPGKPLIAVGALLVIAMGVGGYFFVRGKRDRSEEHTSEL